MKVFILMYYDYDATDFYGVFASKEAAERAIAQRIEEGKRKYASNHPKSGQEFLTVHEEDHCILEEEVIE